MCFSGIKYFLYVVDFEGVLLSILKKVSNRYPPNAGSLKLIKFFLRQLKKHIYRNRIVMGDTSTPQFHK